MNFQIKVFFVIPLKFCTMTFADCLYTVLAVWIAKKKTKIEKNAEKILWEKVSKVKYENA